MLTLSVRPRCWQFVVVLLTAATATPTHGETTLRWKFTQGNSLRYVMHMTMAGKTEIGSTPVTTSSTQLAEISLVIKSVDVDGVASVTQTIDRLRLKMESPQGVMIDYDSAAKGETAGISRVLVPFIEAMVGKPISLKMNARGEVSDVQVPQSMIDGANKVPGLESMGAMFSGEVFGQMFGLHTLPKEPISASDTWTNEQTIKLPAIGEMKVVATFEYLGKEVRDGRELEKIGYTQKMGVSPSKKQPGFEIKLVDQSVSGTIYFDNVAGRFAESKITSKMTMEITAAGKVMTTTTESEVRGQLKPVSKVEEPQSPK